MLETLAWQPISSGFEVGLSKRNILTIATAATFCYGRHDPGRLCDTSSSKSRSIQFQNSPFQKLTPTTRRQSPPRPPAQRSRFVSRRPRAPKRGPPRSPGRAQPKKTKVRRRSPGCMRCTWIRGLAAGGRANANAWGRGVTRKDARLAGGASSCGRAGKAEPEPPAGSEEPKTDGLRALSDKDVRRQKDLRELSRSDLLRLGTVMEAQSRFQAR